MLLRLYFAFLIVSCTSLLPYNLFMNAHEYFLYKLRNTSDVDNSTGQPIIIHQTLLQRNFEGSLTVFGGIACIIGAAINLTFTANLTNTVRIISGYILVLVSLIPTILFTYIDTDDGIFSPEERTSSDQYFFFVISLSLAALASAGSMGFIAGGVLGLVNTYEPIYMQAVLLGQSGAGILSTILSIACQALTSNDIMNGRIYFYIAVIWTICSIYFYVLLVRDSQERSAISGGESTDDNQQLLEEENSEDGGSINEQSTAKKYYMTFQETKFDLFAISVTLFTTLAAFPAVSSLVRSTRQQHEIWQKYFSSVFCFLTFNTGDAIGRICGTKVQFTNRQLIILMALRIMLIPVISICNVVPRKHPSLLFLPYDGVFLLVMVLFAVSHGVCTSQSIGNCAKKASPELKEIAGSILNVFCVTSALIGSLFAVFIVNLL